MKILFRSLPILMAFGTLILRSSAFAEPPRLEVRISPLSFNTGGFTGTAAASSGYLARNSVRTVTSSTPDPARGQASVSASFGVLRVRSGIENVRVNSHEFASHALYRDNRVTDAPGRTGQQGFVTVRYTITGTLLLNAPPAPAGSGQVHSDVSAIHYIRINGSQIVEKHQQLHANNEPFCGDVGCTTYLGVEQTVTYPVTFGTPYDFEFQIVARPRIRTFIGAPLMDALSDMGNTAVWGGIVSVTDAQGNPITDYTDVSASGTNYRMPISPECAAPPAALTSWWPGDNNTRDIRGTNNGVLENGATYTGGRVGQAFNFPTAGARVRVPHAAVLDFSPTQDYTVDFWMKAGPQAAAATLVEKNGGTYPYAVRLMPNGTLSASVSDGTTTASVTSTSGTGAAAAGVVHDNLWHHVAVVFRHSTQTLELYIDGALNASQTYTGTLGTLANGQDLFFGARADGSNPFNGSLDEVDIHNAALTLAQIQSIAAAADLGKCRPAVVPTSVVSRKTHGGTPFDVNLPLSGTSGVESRSGGATSDYQIVATFAAPIAVTGTPQAEVVGGTATVGSNGVANGGAVTISGNTVTIPLTGVTNAQTLSVRLNAADNGANTADVLVPLSVLVGDTNGDRVVNGGDAIQTRARAGQGASETNFRSDVNTDGTINSGDAIAVRSRSGTALP